MCILGDNPTATAKLDTLMVGEEGGCRSAEVGKVGLSHPGSSSCILGGGDGLSCARDILVAKAEGGSSSMSG